MPNNTSTSTRTVESVWDYPRPPRLEREAERVRVMLGTQTIAQSDQAWRLLETSHPPVYYFPPDDIAMGLLTRSAASSFCEFKGQAIYWSIFDGGPVLSDVAWSYPAPSGGFAELADHIAFYAVPEFDCFVGDERVRPQSSTFYGGWITSWIEGPFKGPPGTRFW